VIIDWVPAHSSSEHPWFLEARSSRSSPKRDWYVWRDPVKGPNGGLAPPNNWVAAFRDGGAAWTFDEPSGQYYLHSFLPEQPDLNWDNPEVEAAMHEVLRFWMERGVDGFRADVIHNIGKDPRLPDVEERLAKIPHCVLNDEARTHEMLRGIREVVDSAAPIHLAGRPGDRGGRMMVGEVFLLSTDRVATYYGDHDELHLSFNFPPLFASWEDVAGAGPDRRMADLGALESRPTAAPDPTCRRRHQ
jgi:alpha-glucosidase